MLVGPNGHGKTNVVEAVGYLSTLSSHRVSSDAPLVRSGRTEATISATVVNAGRELTIDVEIVSGAANKARIGGSPTRRTREILGVLQTVVFAPEDLSLVRGDPGDRRRYLDEMMTARRPALAGTRADYDKVLRQRSALLKSAGGALRRASAAGRTDPEAASALSTLDVWDGHLAEYGAQLLVARAEVVHALAPHVTSAYASIARNSRPATIRYRSSLAEALPEGFFDPARAPEDGDVDLVRSAFVAELERVRRKEIERGVSLVGPHRDDLELLLGDGPAKGFASHGESWSFALALRLAPFELLRDEGTDPVLILDDVFAELDRDRRRALVDFASGVEQVLVTAAVEDDIPEVLRAHRFRIRADDGADGRISAVVGSSDGPVESARGSA